MTQSTRRAPARELIEAAHDFPGEYTIKAFGPANNGFREAVAVAIEHAVGARHECRERLGSKGNSMCITVVLQVETVDEVLRTYERLHLIADLKLIL